MKRIVTLCFVALATIGAASAQGYGGGPGFMGQIQPGQAIQAQTQLVETTIEGKLALVQGHPALVVKDKTWFVQMPMHLYGFIDGLKEGATVKLAGYEIAIPYAPNSYFFRVTTLTLGAKSYDLSEFLGGSAMGGRGSAMGGRGGMMGGYGNTGDRFGRGRW